METNVKHLLLRKTNVHKIWRNELTLKSEKV